MEDNLWEQATISYFYQKNKASYDKKNRMNVVQQITFNSFPEETEQTTKCKPGRYEPNDLLVCFTGVSTKEKIFDRYYEAVAKQDTTIFNKVTY
jgi:hypothetical protein